VDNAAPSILKVAMSEIPAEQQQAHAAAIDTLLAEVPSYKIPTRCSSHRPFPCVIPIRCWSRPPFHSPIHPLRALISTDHPNICEPFHGAADGSVGGGDLVVAGEGATTPKVQQAGAGRQIAVVGEQELSGPRHPSAPHFCGDTYILTVSNRMAHSEKWPFLPSQTYTHIIYIYMYVYMYM